MTADEIERRCIERRMRRLDNDPWFIALDDEGQCEAMTIAYMLGMHDAGDIRRTDTAEKPEGA